MRAQYEALVRKSDAFAYWPLGRQGWVDVVGGRHFGSTQALRIIEGDGIRLAEEVASRAAVTTVTNNFSMEIWVYRESPQSGRRIFTNGSYASTNGYHISYASDTTGRFRATAIGTADLATSARPLLPFQWNHIVVVRDANVWMYYLNGELDTANAGTTLPAGISGANTIVGSQAGTGGVDGYRGAAIYTRVLTASEVRDHYLEGANYVGPFFLGGEMIETNPIKLDDATVTVDLSVTSVDFGVVNDAATVYVDIQPSATEVYTRFDAATVYLNLSVLGGECYSTFSGTLFGEGEANLRWYSSADQERWVDDEELRWDEGDVTLGEGVHC